MHYYPRRLGDYSTATTHLSMLEHGAYTKLLDYYYSTEKPLPADRCERIAGAYETHEREAVSSVLQQFFTLTDSGWVNAKADEVISDFRAKSLKAKESAGKRWKRTESDGNANACANAMLTQNSKPITQKEEQKKEHPRERGASKKPLPADFSVSERVEKWAESKGYGRLADHLEAFKGAAIARGYRYADWDQAFMNAIRDDWAKLRVNGHVIPAGGGRREL